MTSRLTMNVGLRFDRYRSFLPEQEGPSGGRFTAATPTHYDEVSDVKTFNHPVPRIGLIFDVTGEGRTVIKANYAKYFWNPGTDISNNLNPNSQDYYTRRAWTDRDNDLLYDPGEEGNISQSFGGVGTTQLDPNLNNTYTSEISAWAEHELFPGVGLQGGYVYREIDDFRVRVNVNRPISAYNVPITLRDPGPDGAFGNADDGAELPGVQPERSGAGGAGRQPAHQPRWQGRVPDGRVRHQQAADRPLVARRVDVEALEQGPRDHLLRPEPPHGDDAVDAERPHQHRRRPVRVQHVDRQDQRQLRAARGRSGSRRRCASSRDSPSAARSSPPPPTASAASAASTTARRASCARRSAPARRTTS